MMLFVIGIVVMNFAYGFLDTGKAGEYAKTTLKKYLGYATILFISTQLDKSGLFQAIQFDTSLRLLSFLWVGARELRVLLGHLAHMGIEIPNFLHVGIDHMEVKTGDRQNTYEHQDIVNQINSVNEGIDTMHSCPHEETPPTSNQNDWSDKI